MSDPLSIAASAAGLVSLGLTVCSGLLDYYKAWTDQDSDVSIMCESLDALSRTFELLDDKVRHPLLDRKSVDRVTESIIACAAGIQGLRSKLDKIRNAKPGMSARLQRAQYPFQQKTLEKLLRTIADLRSNLNLATNALHLDVSITSLHHLKHVDISVKHLMDHSEVFSTQILDSIARVHLNQKQEMSRALDSEEQDVIHWLCPLEFYSKHNDALSRRQESTGRWFLQSFEFRSWLDTAGKVIWCPGIPGAGKTILASTVIDHLEQRRGRENIGVAYIYCVHNSPNQTASNFLGSLLKQLAMQSLAMLDDLKSCYKHYAPCGTRPLLKEIAKLLRLQVEKFDEVFIVIDALDECPELDQTRKELLTEVRGLLPKVRLMVTSRNIPSIENMFKHDKRLEIRAQDQDIRKFIESQIERREELLDLLEGHDDVRCSIISRIIERANGMFLIAALHMDSLASEDNIRELEESLQRLPGDLDRTYDDALERIKGQDSRKRARADQVLMLISCATRPLVLSEMRQALSIRRGDTYLDPKALPKPQVLISTCCGLVVVEDRSQIVRFVHYTTEEYFRRKLHQYRSPEAHQYFAGVLITYLSLSAFGSFSRDSMIEGLSKKAAQNSRVPPPKWDVGYDEEDAVRNYMTTFLENNILMRYAAENWGHHARIALTNYKYDPGTCLATADSHDKTLDISCDLTQLIPDFLTRKPNIACANEVLHHLETKFDDWVPSVRSPIDVTDLHIAASFGLKFFVELFLHKGADINARDSGGVNALHKAAKNGHLEVVQLLVNSGAAIGTLDRNGLSALVWAAKMNKISVSRFLLQHMRDLGLGSTDDGGVSAMSIAATAGHEAIVELLAEHETEGSERIQLMGDALIEAALNEREGVVRLLISGGNRWAISKPYLATAMIKAASEGHVRIMKILIGAGVDVNAPLPSVLQSSTEAATQDTPEDRQESVPEEADTSLIDDNCDLPLHAAVRIVNVAAVAQLLKNAADVNALNAEGETAIVVLAQSVDAFFGSVSTSRFRDSMVIMQQLLERGADTAVKDCKLHRTPLEWAVFQGHTSLVRLLLQRERASVTRKKTMVYLTELYYAIWTEDRHSINNLLGRKEIQDLDSTPELLLVYIPAQAGYDGVLLRFLHSGAAIEAKTPYGESALHLAAARGHIKTLELLLNQAADIESQNISGETPLVCAASAGDIRAVKLLLEHGARIDAPSVDSRTSASAITQALYGGSPKVIKMLLDKGADPDFRDIEAHGGTLLHIVSRNQPGGSQTRSIQLLLEYGADLEAKDEDGKTPLAGAVEDYTFEAIPTLLERGADLEARDNNGRTPLGAAVENGSLPAAHLFLQNGANLEAKDSNDHTPLLLAVRLGNVEMVHFLLEGGADPHAFSPAVTVENEWIYDLDFEKTVTLVLEAQSKTR